jgi:hypothetical protein
MSAIIQTHPWLRADNWLTDFAITPVSTDPISFARREYRPAPLPYFDRICLRFSSLSTLNWNNLIDDSDP